MINRYFTVGILIYRFCFILSLVLICPVIFSQQYPAYSQYIFNEFFINPSVAGIDGMTTINISARKQWLGLTYSPETYAATISSRILKSPLRITEGKVRKGTEGRVGLGAALYCDKNGAFSRTSIQFAYAYHIYLRNTQLSMGLKVYGTQIKIDGELINFRVPDSPEIQNLLIKSTFIPDAGLGINLSSENLHIGLSATNLLQSIIKIGDAEFESDDLRHLRQYSLHGFYRIILPDKDWLFEPSAIVHGNEKLRFNADLTGRFIYKREYWTGLSLRTSGEFVLILGLKINRFYLGYSFDYGFNKLSYNSYGSHELALAIKLGDSIRRYRWLERY